MSTSLLPIPWLMLVLGAVVIVLKGQKKRKVKSLVGTTGLEFYLADYP